MFPASQEEEGPAGPRLSGIEQGGQVQIPVDGAGPAQHRVLRTGTAGSGDPGEQGIGHPVGQQGDVAAARGEALCQLRGGGEHHISGRGQGAFPGRGQVVPLPVAVVDQTVVVQTVQQVDLLRAGAPEQGGAEAVLLHAPGDEAGQPELFQTEQRPVPLVRGEQKGGQGVHCDVGLDGPPLGAESNLPPAAGGRKKEDLGVLQPGDELLGASGGVAPGLVGQTDDLLQNGPPVKTPRALAWARESRYNKSV